MKGASRIFGFVLLSCLFAPGLASAQDALQVGEGVYKKVLENERIRVLEASFKPGAKVGVHSHPDHLLYMLTDGSLTLKPSGRTPYEITFTRGEALWLPAQSRGAENDGEKTVRALIVEFKTATRTARRYTARRGSGRRGRRR